MNAPVRRRASAITLAALLCASVILVFAGNAPESTADPGKVNGRIAFASSRDGNFEIYAMDADGTNEERITNNAAADLSPSWSPNGTKIAFVRANSIHVMDADGTDVRKLTQSGLVSSDPVWSADGKKILFSAVTDGTDRDIYEIDAGGGQPKDLTSNSPSDDFEPRWTLDGFQITFTSRTNGSNYGIFMMGIDGQDRVMIFGNNSSMHPQPSPVGTRIVFSGNLQKSFDIYTMNYDGSNVTRLTGGTSNETQPSWSADGTKIVFASNKGSKHEQVHIMNHDGTNPQRLTKNQQQDLSPEIQPLTTAVNEQLPVLRENGMIAFAGERNGTFAELYLMHPDGSNVTQISSNTESVDSYPKWSPSGDKIAFVSTLASHEEIVVANADGTNRTALIQSTSPFAGLGWSPNGTQLVFAKGDVNHRWIFVMDADGVGVKRLTITNSMDSDPSWSPDGTKIAFTRHIENNDEIYVMDADGTKQKRLTDNSASDSYPRWSPEAEQIVFVTDRDGNEEVYIMNADGKGEKNLTNSTAIDLFPSWSPDGSRIIFVSDRLQDGQDIYIMDSDGKNAERLTIKEGAEKQPDFGSATYTGREGHQVPFDEPEIFELPLDTSDPSINSEFDLVNVTAGMPAAIAVVVTNNDETRLRLHAIIQVMDEAGVTQYIDSVKGAVPPEGRMDIAFSWTPNAPGTYEIVVFVIENSEHPQVFGHKVFGKLTVLPATESPL